MLQIVDTLFSGLSHNMWEGPYSRAMAQAERQKQELLWKLNGTKGETLPCMTDNSDRMAIHSVSFDAEKCLNCTIDNKQTLVHSGAGKGYCLSIIPLRSGCFKWKVSGFLEPLTHLSTVLGVIYKLCYIIVKVHCISKMHVTCFIVSFIFRYSL